MYNYKEIVEYVAYSRSSASLCFVMYLNADGCISKEDTVIDIRTPILNPCNGCILL